LIMPEKS